MSRASLFLDNSHEGRPFTSVVDQVVDFASVLVLGNSSFLKAKA